MSFDGEPTTEPRSAERAERRAEMALRSSANDREEDVDAEQGMTPRDEASLTKVADEPPVVVVEPLVLVHLPTGDELLSPAMAEACNAELARRRKKEEERAAYEEVRRDYYLKIGKPYPD